jgi:hypothetical protein
VTPPYNFTDYVGGKGTCLHHNFTDYVGGKGTWLHHNFICRRFAHNTKAAPIKARLFYLRNSRLNLFPLRILSAA